MEYFVLIGLAIVCLTYLIQHHWNLKSNKSTNTKISFKDFSVESSTKNDENDDLHTKKH